MRRNSDVTVDISEKWHASLLFYGLARLRRLDRGCQSFLVNNQSGSFIFFSSLNLKIS